MSNQKNCGNTKGAMDSTKNNSKNTTKNATQNSYKNDYKNDYKDKCGTCKDESEMNNY